MAAETQNYLVFLLIAVLLVLADGQVIRVSGRAYLRQAYGNDDVAGSVNRLVTVLFHFLVLGLIGLVSTIDIEVGSPTQTIVARLAIVLLILGIAHWITLAVYGRLRDRQLARVELTRVEADNFVAETEDRAHYVARQEEAARQQFAKQQDLNRQQAVADRMQPPPQPPGLR